MMFGSQAPRPMATPKNAVKQIMPAMTRFGNMPEHDAERIALGVARGIGRERLLRPGNAEAGEHVERFLASAVRRQIARRFRQREAEHPDDQRADADDDPDAAPHMIRSPATHAGEHSTSAVPIGHTQAPPMKCTIARMRPRMRFRRIFAGIGEGERLLGAETDAGDEAADDQQRDARGERAEDGEDAEQQQVELIDESAAEPVAELTLAGGADEHAEDGGAADGRDFGSGRELRSEDVRNERAEDGEVDDVEEISGGDERDDFSDAAAMIFASSNALPTKPSIV